MNRRVFLDHSLSLTIGLAGRKVLVRGPLVSKSQNTFTDAFVTISEKYPFYFELTDGNPFIVNGPCLAYAPDMETMELYFKNLSANGGNFARVWLCSYFFEIEQKFGVYDEAHAQHIDILLAWAIQYRIKLKLCLDNTRQIISDTSAPFNKPQYHADHGGPFLRVDEYINTAQGKNAYLNRMLFLKKRYGDHPAILGWELWNEMNGIMCSGLETWNEEMLPRVHQLFPRNLVMQSLGSFDRDTRRPDYRRINELAANQVGQIHRYIDSGAQLPVCTAPMDVLAADAIAELRSYGIKKPMLLSEVGAVLSNHAGASELYPLDKDGTLLHDMLFAPFFSGAAGTGNSWHWDTYIHRNNLWYHFGRFHEAVKDINPIAEQFVPLNLEHNRFRVYVLKGNYTILAWCRDINNDWRSEFKEGKAPEAISNQVVNFNSLIPGLSVISVNTYDPWQHQWEEVSASARVNLPVFKRSIIIQIKKRT